MNKFAAVVATVLVLGMCLAALATGPVGPESVVHKDIAMIIRDVARSVNASVLGPKPVEPSRVPLSMSLELKRVLKSAASFAGVSYPAAEHAEEFALVLGGLSEPVHCLVRFRGDHVISVALSESATEALKESIRSRFPGYTIHLLPNLAFQRTPTAPLT